MTHPVRRCTKCDYDWPNTSKYNLCAICQRNTHASTAEERPNYPAADILYARHARIREHDARVDRQLDEARQTQIAELDALFAAPAYDHPDHPQSKIVLPPIKSVASPQAVHYKRYGGDQPHA